MLTGGSELRLLKGVPNEDGKSTERRECCTDRVRKDRTTGAKRVTHSLLDHLTCG